MLLLLPLYSETAITGKTVAKKADKKRSQSKLTNASSPKAAASLVPQSMPAAAVGLLLHAPIAAIMVTLRMSIIIIESWKV